MFAFALRFWKPLAVLAFAAALWGHGYKTGHDRAQAAYELAAAKAMAGQVKALNDLAAAEQRNRLLAQELEDAARAEPPSAPACLPRSRVLRLQSR